MDLTNEDVANGTATSEGFNPISGQMVAGLRMTDTINSTAYNTSLQNIAQFAGIYDDGRSDDKGVEPESVVVLEYNGRRYSLGGLERITAGNKTVDPTDIDPFNQGGLLAVYDVTDVNNVDFVTYQQMSRSPEGLEVIEAGESPTSRVLLGVSAEFDSNSVDFLDVGALLNNGNGSRYLGSGFANPATFDTL